MIYDNIPSTGKFIRWPDDKPRVAFCLLTCPAVVVKHHDQIG